MSKVNRTSRRRKSAIPRGMKIFEAGTVFVGSNSMVFEAGATGRPIARLPLEVTITTRRPDGSRYFDLDSAAAKFGVSKAALRHLFEATFPGALE